MKTPLERELRSLKRWTIGELVASAVCLYFGLYSVALLAATGAFACAAGADMMRAIIAQREEDRREQDIQL